MDLDLGESRAVDSQQVLSKKKLRELVAQVHPNERLDPEVEAVLLDLADEFVHSVTKSACQLAQHRQSTTLDVKDIQMHLETNYNIRIPGFAAPEPPTAHKTSVPTAHQQRLNQVKKAIHHDLAEKEKQRTKKQ